MTDFEDFIVDKPYSPNKEEKSAIDALKQKGLKPEHWGSKRKGIVSFKDNMREHMYYKQKCRCAYCRIQLPIACCFLQREHIVPKALHPKWMFYPRNLCFTCDKCNNYKKDAEVLRNPDTNNYPTDSNDFLIINPFIDRYSDHIELKGDLLYVGKTEKGCFTINTCHLYDPEFAIERAKKKMENENPDSIQAQLLSLLSENNILSDEIKKIKKKTKMIVQMYKKR